MANLAILGVVDEEAKKEFMKIKNMSMTWIGKAANTYEKEANSAKLQMTPPKHTKSRTREVRTLSALSAATRDTNQESAPTTLSAAIAREPATLPRHVNQNPTADSSKRTNARIGQGWQRPRG